MTRVIMNLVVLSLIAASIVLSGCSSNKSRKDDSRHGPVVDYAAERERLEKSNDISPGFTLEIRHSADVEISGEYFVDFNGEIKLPYKVTVKAAGATPDEVRERITKAYASFFKSGNKVSVEVSKKEYLIETRGLIQKPGRYAVRLDTSLEEIVAMAGGFPTTGGDAKAASITPEYVRIVRRNFKNPKEPPSVTWIRVDDYFSKYEAKNELFWKGGEQLIFQQTADPEALKSMKSHTIQVMGEVHKPGEYPIQQGADLYTYIAKSGGPTATADLTSINVIHRANQDSVNVDITGKGVVENLQPGDIILVRSTQTKASGFERTLPILLSITSIATSIFLIVFAL